MRQLWIVLAAILVLGECRRFRSDDEGEVETNCANKDVEKYLDNVLEKVRQELDDPMRLPPRSSVVEFSDGVLWGMSELKRIGDVEVICEGEKVTIKAKLTTDELKGRYTWTKERSVLFDRKGNVVFIAKDFEADITLVIEKKEDEVTHPQLENFTVKKFKNPKIEVSGGGLFGWSVGEVSTLISGIFQRVVAKIVEGPITEALEKQLREVNLE